MTTFIALSASLFPRGHNAIQIVFILSYLIVHDLSDYVYRFVRTRHPLLPPIDPLTTPAVRRVLDDQLATGSGLCLDARVLPLLVAADVVAHGVEAQALYATVLSEDFCGDPRYLLVEIIEVVGLED